MYSETVEGILAEIRQQPFEWTSIKVLSNILKILACITILIR